MVTPILTRCCFTVQANQDLKDQEVTTCLVYRSFKSWFSPQRRAWHQWDHFQWAQWTTSQILMEKGRVTRAKHFLGCSIWYSRRTRHRTRIWGVRGCTSTCRTIACRPCSIPVGTNRYLPACYSPHTVNENHNNKQVYGSVHSRDIRGNPCGVLVNSRSLPFMCQNSLTVHERWSIINVNQTTWPVKHLLQVRTTKFFYYRPLNCQLSILLWFFEWNFHSTSQNTSPLLGPDIPLSIFAPKGPRLSDWPWFSAVEFVQVLSGFLRPPSWTACDFHTTGK